MTPRKEILYCSTLCSKEVFDYINKTSTDKSGHAIQKFHDLIIKGLAMNQSNVVETLSSIPVVFAINKKRFWILKSEQIDKIRFNYIPAINFPIIKNLIDFIYSFLKILFWKFRIQNAQRVIICDALKLSLGAGIYYSCKIRGIKVIGIVTDIPGLGVLKKIAMQFIRNKIIHFFNTRYDGYILITKHMNSIVNPNNKPSIIMEGLVDNFMVDVKNQYDKKDKERILLYAGRIYERYGIKTLIEAFMRIKDLDIRLDIYGTGPMETEMPQFMNRDNRIRYFGVVPNEIVIERQLKATLLINPRPSLEGFTKYSYPSKNMEYMVSGTPVVTTLLPGMPEEYFPFVYLFRDESVEGLYMTLKWLLDKPRLELHDFGNRARDFVLTHKNNFEQGRKITCFIDQVLRF